MRISDIHASCQLDSTGAALVRSAVERLGLSARGYHRVVRVSRAIAELDNSERIQQMQLVEAFEYHPRDRSD